MKRQKTDLASVAENSIALWYRPCAIRILGPFAMDVRAQSGQSVDGRWLVEDCHVIDHFEGSDHFSAVRLGDDRPLRPLDGANACIAVEPNDQDIAKSFGVAKTADVTDVQQIEAAICPDDDFPGLAPPGSECGQFVERLNFGTKQASPF